MLCGKSCTITVVEWDRDDVLVFVSSAVQFSVFPRLKQLVQISVFKIFDHGRHFPRGKIQITATRLEQCDYNIPLTNSSRARQFTIKASCGRYQGQRDMAPGPESYPPSFHSLFVIRIRSIPWSATQLPVHASRR